MKKYGCAIIVAKNFWKKIDVITTKHFVVQKTQNNLFIEKTIIIAIITIIVILMIMVVFVAEEKVIMLLRVMLQHI